MTELRAGWVSEQGWRHTAWSGVQVEDPLAAVHNGLQVCMAGGRNSWELRVERQGE